MLNITSGGSKQPFYSVADSVAKYQSIKVLQPVLDMSLGLGGARNL